MHVTQPAAQGPERKQHRELEGVRDPKHGRAHSKCQSIRKQLGAGTQQTGQQLARHPAGSAGGGWGRHSTHVRDSYRRNCGRADNLIGRASGTLWSDRQPRRCCTCSALTGSWLTSQHQERGRFLVSQAWHQGDRTRAQEPSHLVAWEGPQGHAPQEVSTCTAADFKARDSRKEGEAASRPVSPLPGSLSVPRAPGLGPPRGPRTPAHDCAPQLVRAGGHAAPCPQRSGQADTRSLWKGCCTGSEQVGTRLHSQTQKRRHYPALPRRSKTKRTILDKRIHGSQQFSLSPDVPRSLRLSPYLLAPQIPAVQCQVGLPEGSHPARPAPPIWNLQGALPWGVRVGSGRCSGRTGVGPSCLSPALSLGCAARSPQGSAGDVSLRTGSVRPALGCFISAGPTLKV